MLQQLLRTRAPHSRMACALYRRFCHPNGYEWADVIRRQRRIYHMGDRCSISSDTQIADPELTWLGNGVVLAGCALVCHDGAIQVLWSRYGARLDSIGPIIIEDDCFVGIHAMILGGVTIGAGSIVGAGAVVRQSIPAGSIAIGNPATVKARVEDWMRLLQANTESAPWGHLIAKREGSFDPIMEPELRRLRQEHFFGTPR